MKSILNLLSFEITKSSSQISISETQKDIIKSSSQISISETQKDIIKSDCLDELIGEEVEIRTISGNKSFSGVLFKDRVQDLTLGEEVDSYEVCNFNGYPNVYNVRSLSTIHSVVDEDKVIYVPESHFDLGTRTRTAYDFPQDSNVDFYEKKKGIVNSSWC